MSYVVEGVIVVVAGFVQSLTGFGFALIAMPFFLLFHEPGDAVFLSVLISLTTMSSLAFLLRRNVNWSLFRRLIAGGLAGAPLGISLYVYLDLTLIKVFIGCLIIAFTFFGLKQIRFPLRGRRYEYAVGMMSGFLTTSVGIPGPPLVLFLANRNVPKDEMRATAAMCFIPIYGASLLLHVVFNQALVTDTGPWNAYVLGLMALALFGQWVGRRFDIRLDQAKFQRAVYLVLLLAGMYITVDSVWELVFRLMS